MELNALKEEIDRLRAKAQGKRPHFPGTLWDRIIKLSEQFDSRFLATELGINQQNLVRQIKKRGQEEGAKSAQNRFLEVPSGLIGPTKKHLLLELPHGVSLRFEL